MHNEVIFLVSGVVSRSLHQEVFVAGLLNGVSYILPRQQNWRQNRLYLGLLKNTSRRSLRLTDELSSDANIADLERPWTPK